MERGRVSRPLTLGWSTVGVRREIPENAPCCLAERGSRVTSPYLHSSASLRSNSRFPGLRLDHSAHRRLASAIGVIRLTFSTSVIRRPPSSFISYTFLFCLYLYSSDDYITLCNRCSIRKSFKGFEGRDLEVKEKRGFIGSRMGLVANQPRDSPVFRLSRYVAQSLSESFSRFVTTVRTLNSGSVVTVPFTVSLNVSYALSMYARIPSTWA